MCNDDNLNNIFDSDSDTDTDSDSDDGVQYYINEFGEKCVLYVSPDGKLLFFPLRDAYRYVFNHFRSAQPEPVAPQPEPVAPQPEPLDPPTPEALTNKKYKRKHKQNETYKGKPTNASWRYRPDGKYDNGPKDPDYYNKYLKTYKADNIKCEFCKSELVRRNIPRHLKTNKSCLKLRAALEEQT